MLSAYQLLFIALGIHLGNCHLEVNPLSYLKHDKVSVDIVKYSLCSIPGL